ncbi:MULTISPECIES: nuclear transport factor 2 family protein [Rhizobium]|nr:MULTISPECIES: nuclear transport factor 2 family protein [Rhizobium]ARO26895.1 hypothetical protein TAL182_PC00288 [Rhizobium sp. TAL182]MBB4194482.1 hypothetical protein [Rhizobium aethiopicum]MBB4582345.1 hypothetical protein [Rhizobium aethiopicum]
MIAKRSATVLSVLPRDRRADEAGLRSSFWPDAQDVHGAYTGSAEGFIEFTLGVFKTEPRNIHQITNVLIEFISPAKQLSRATSLRSNEGRTAAGSYVARFLLCGRYCDHFQKREGEWRIADRTVVYDWLEEQTQQAASPEIERFGFRQPIGTSHSNDPVYTLGSGKEHESRGGIAARSAGAELFFSGTWC